MNKKYPPKINLTYKGSYAKDHVLFLCLLIGRFCSSTIKCNGIRTRTFEESMMEQSAHMIGCYLRQYLTSPNKSVLETLTRKEAIQIIYAMNDYAKRFDEQKYDGLIKAFSRSFGCELRIFDFGTSLAKRLHNKGIQIRYRISDSTNSLYLVLDGGVLKGIRLSDHKTSNGYIKLNILLSDDGNKPLMDLDGDKRIWNLTDENENELRNDVVEYMLMDRETKMRQQGISAYQRNANNSNEAFQFEYEIYDDKKAIRA